MIISQKLYTLYCGSTDTHQYLHSQLCPSNVYKRSIAYGQVVRFKRIFSTEEKLNIYFEQLELWLIKRGYREFHVDSKIERIKLVERTVSFQIQDKKVDYNIQH